MNKIELLQEKYNSKKNDMSKEELLEKEVSSYSSIFQNSEIRRIKDLKNKIKEMGNK